MKAEYLEGKLFYFYCCIFLLIIKWIFFIIKWSIDNFYISKSKFDRILYNLLNI